MTLWHQPAGTSRMRQREQELQQRHVDLQRLWKRLAAAPQSHTGRPGGGAAAAPCPNFQVRSAGGATEFPPGPSGASWQNRPQIVAADGTPAVCLLPPGGITKLLASQNHGFNIPSGAVIRGITVRIIKQGGPAPDASVEDVAVWLTKDGQSPAGPGQRFTGPWPATMTLYIYGGEGNLWGVNWTAADINNSTFGAAIQASAFHIVGTARAAVDQIEIAVCYA